MDIGTKIREARLAAQLTQEQTAEALGVSRQTMSNWENNKTYPDIVSVIKMSDLFDVSLDHLLKEKEEMPMSNYIDYLEESTNIVKSKAKLSKVILIATYLGIWAFALIIFWLFTNGSDAMGYSFVFLWIILPFSTFVISLLIGKNNYWGNLKWTVPVVFGIMHMLAEYATFSISNMIANLFTKINVPHYELILIGAFIYNSPFIL
ncbi:helix-turn-helix domain-containing protein [Fusobacterium polymorphum]|uniref:helix-turn-helix domain-containing protein n=1 Tax=Fusobacterium nucleatum subsp. polymorphum TaxID=76857 RepID=UPI00300AFB7B